MKKQLILIFLVIGLIGLLTIDGFAEKNKEERIRFKFHYQLENLVLPLDFSLKDHAHFEVKQFEELLGNWMWNALDDSTGQGEAGTFNSLYYKPGDAIFVRGTRSINIAKVKKRFAFELEGKIIRNVWIVTCYNQTSEFVINTTEKREKIIFVEFEEVYNSITNSSEYYKYSFKADRQQLVRKTSEKFSSTNFQIYLKGEIEKGFLQMFAGIGADLFISKLKREKRDQIRALMPWSGKLKETENTQFLAPVEYADIKKLTRPFVVMGIQAKIFDKLSVGVQTKLFPRDEDVRHEKDFLFPLSQNCSKTWKIVPNERQIAFFLSFGF